MNLNTLVKIFYDKQHNALLLFLQIMAKLEGYIWIASFRQFPVEI